MTKAIKSKKICRRTISLVLAVIMLFSTFAIYASAAYTTRTKCVNYNAVSGGTISQRRVEYTIKGNLLTKKSVKIVGDFSFLNKTSKDAYNKLARFNVSVYDKNNSYKCGYSGLRLGNSFKLPVGTQNYKVVVTSYFSGYNYTQYDQAAAIYGYYKIQY